jgi:predicted Rossmann fold flavoprotein
LGALRVHHNSIVFEHFLSMRITKMSRYPSYHTDILILGAGAAGLMCALTAARRGRRVCVVDHNAKPAEKIRISGGGRCNFTNLHTHPSRFISENPRFCISALSRTTPEHFLALMHTHGIAYHEKTLGQLFCDGSAQQIIDMLMQECAQAGAEVRLSTSVQEVTHSDGCFKVQTSAGLCIAESLVVACGGLSIPKMGATGRGYEIAKQFGLPLIPTTPALVPFTLPPEMLQWSGLLSGIAAPVRASIGKHAFEEALLFTHRGLSGPAILQISSYWQEGKPVTVQFLPDTNIAAMLKSAKANHPKQEISSVVAALFPKRMATSWVQQQGVAGNMADLSHATLEGLARSLSQWQVIPAGTEGYRTAEVTRGGVDTRALSSQTMQANDVKGLYFIGEVVDVTGHLGGYNFQWAWASGHAAGLAA